MKDFARLQSDFQHAILTGDDTILAEILDSPKQVRTVLFDVYRDAYVLRLVEAMSKSYELMYSYMGNEMFDEMGRAYVAKHPSHHPSIRWYARNLSRFLADTEPYSDYPILTELAWLESALNDAFDAPDGKVVALSDLQAIDPATWQDLVFAPHASVRRTDVTTNLLPVWTALRDDEEVPEAEVVETPEAIVVWRQDSSAMVRSLGVEEAMMWDEAAKGIPFGQLCAMLATYDDPDGAAGRAASYLGQWVTAGMLADATVS